MSELRKIFSELKDYSTRWEQYFPVYEQYLSKFRGMIPTTMIEIGVLGGGGLEMWRKYLGPGVKLIGVDIDPFCKKYETDSTSIEIGDQADPRFWKTLFEKYGPVDIVLDDGGHRMDQQIQTLKSCYPNLKNGGVYICEDTHTNYWDSHGGGRNKPDTFLNYAKQITDVLNAQYDKHFSVDPNLVMYRDAKAVHFYDSMVVIEKDRDTPSQTCEVGRSNFKNDQPDFITISTNPQTRV